MKILLNENQVKRLINVILSEQTDSEYEFFELLRNTTYEVFESIKNQQKIKVRKVNPVQYKRALSEFMKYGEFFRFPEKIIFKWKDLILENIALLSSVTEVCGHSQYFPFDEFNDVFFGDEERERHVNTYEKAIEILEEYNDEDYLPTFSNGQLLISDYGLNPLLKLAEELCNQDDPKEIIVTINKIIDVSHQRSDLAELFIEGGSNVLYDISNN